MSHGDAVHHSSQSDIDEIENLINASVQAGPATVLPAPPSPSPPSPSSPPVSTQKSLPVPPPTSGVPSFSSGSSRWGIPADGFGPPPNTLTEPVWDTVKGDLTWIVTNLKLVVLPNPSREDPGKALRGWELLGPSS